MTTRTTYRAGAARAALPLAAGLFAALAGAAPAFANQADAQAVPANEPIQLAYEVYFSGLHVLSSQAELERDTADYRLTARAQTRGIAAFLFNWRGETETIGRLDDGRVVPQRHISHGKSPTRQRKVEMLYGEDGAVTSVTIDPEPDWSEVNPLPENADQGTIDPLSMITELAAHFTDQQRCEAEYAVFDGRRRYDLMLGHLGERQVEPNADMVFSGNAMACEVSYEILGGDRKEKSEYVTTARDRIVYVGRPLPNMPPVPVYLEIETGMGTLKGYLTGVTMGDRVLALEEDDGGAADEVKSAWVGANGEK